MGIIRDVKDGLVWPNDFINKIIQGDCLEIMKDIPDNSIDLVLTDPPYGIDYFRHIVNPKYVKIVNDNTLDWLDDFMLVLKRVMSLNCSLYCFCSWHNIDKFKIAIENFFVIRNIIVWNKGGGGMGDLETTFGGIYELCIFANVTPQKLYGGRDVDVVNIGRSGNNFHPTEKSVDLMSFLIQKSSKPNDIILDPFIGSGTTAVACKQLNRNYIGIELDEKYCNIARKRINSTMVPIF